ncbi:MAG: methylmalonyl Co-A mutase-associated GTPase MeaB [Bacillota bacterium]
MLESINDLLESFNKGNIRALARIISKIENEDPAKDEILKSIYPKTGRAHVLGITGSPGAGKSSLVDRITAFLRKKGDSVGIIAVDPTSPFTGGALLGDRIRMQDHAVDKGVYIRSMGTRGSLGGLARSTKEVVKALDAYGYSWVIVETVGVGQAELDIMHVADTTMVVMTPGAGDSIQTIKAGIMEIADIFVVNKSDLPGADKVVSEISQMLDLQSGILEWRPPVIKVSTLDDRGMKDLMESVEKHINYLKDAGIMQSGRDERARRETLEIVDYRWQKIVSQQVNYRGKVQDILDRVSAGKTDPFTAAGEILSYIIGTDNMRGEEVLEILLVALEELKKNGRRKGMSGYGSYLHGQIYGLATALRIIYPGHGNIGEKAALAVRPVLTEHSCLCGDKETTL